MDRAESKCLGSTHRVYGAGIVRFVACGLLVLAPLFAAAAAPANPAVVDNAVFVADHGISRFDAPGTTPLWQALAGTYHDDPVVAGEVVLTGGSAGLHALDSNSGKLLWRRAGAGRRFTPTVADDIAYVGGVDGSLQAVDLDNGDLLWVRRFEGWIYSPAVFADRLIVSGEQRRLQALSKSSGALLWAFDLPNEAVFRPVAVRDQTAMVTTFSGHVLAVAVADGSLRWQQKDAVPSQSPVVADGRLYFRSFARTLIARDVNDGRLLWQSSIPLAERSVAAAQDRVAAIATDHSMLVLDGADGTLLARHTLPGEVIGSPAVVGDQWVVMTRGGGRGKLAEPNYLELSVLADNITRNEAR